jgi:hypothetical protein
MDAQVNIARQNGNKLQWSGSPILGWLISRLGIGFIVIYQWNFPKRILTVSANFIFNLIFPNYCLKPQ